MRGSARTIAAQSKGYEAHITFMAPKGFQIWTNGWKFSKIDGDPVLGDGVKCYLTKHFKITNDKHQEACIVAEMRDIQSKIEVFDDVKGTRIKLELIVFDEITKND